MITDPVTKTDFNSICYCVAFDSGLKNFWKCFFFSRNGILCVDIVCVKFSLDFTDVYSF